MRIVFFALWVPVAVVAALLLARLAWRETRAPLVAVLAAFVAAAGLIVFPRAVVDTVSATRTNRNYDIAQAKLGAGRADCLVKFVTCVNERVWAELRQKIPAGEPYYVQTSSALIRFWTYTSLLPLTAVQDPRRADWIVSYRHDPHGLGIALARTWNLGRVSTKAHAKATLELAKVKR